MDSKYIQFFSRLIFKECILKNVPDFELYDDNKKFLEYDKSCFDEYYRNDKKKIINNETHSYWYCMDNCWTRRKATSNKV